MLHPLVHLLVVAFIFHSRSGSLSASLGSPELSRRASARCRLLLLAKATFTLGPGTFAWPRLWIRIPWSEKKARLWIRNLVELTLQDYKMLKYLPSTICASAIYLALKTRGKTPWTPDLEKHSTYKEADLQACVRDIHELHEKATTNSLQAVRKKYTQEKHGNVSSIAPAHLGL